MESLQSTFSHPIKNSGAVVLSVFKLVRPPFCYENSAGLPCERSATRRLCSGRCGQRQQTHECNANNLHPFPITNLNQSILKLIQNILTENSEHLRDLSPGTAASGVKGIFTHALHDSLRIRPRDRF